MGQHDEQASLTDAAFWLREARQLREAAEQSWKADLNVLQQTKLMYSPQHDQVLRHATEELGVELNLLYRYLISLAIQYLAIALLVKQDPRYILQNPPGHRIISLLQASEVSLTALQHDTLRQIEVEYSWADRDLFAGQVDSQSDLRTMAHRLSGLEQLSREEKGGLDQLYADLDSRVAQLVTGQEG